MSNLDMDSLTSWEKREILLFIIDDMNRRRYLSKENRYPKQIDDLVVFLKASSVDEVKEAFGSVDKALVLAHRVLAVEQVREVIVDAMSDVEKEIDILSFDDLKASMAQSILAMTLNKEVRALKFGNVDLSQNFGHR